MHNGNGGKLSVESELMPCFGFDVFKSCRVFLDISSHSHVGLYRITIKSGIGSIMAINRWIFIQLILKEKKTKTEQMDMFRKRYTVICGLTMQLFKYFNFNVCGVIKNYTICPPHGHESKPNSITVKPQINLIDLTYDYIYKDVIKIRPWPAESK